MNLYYINFNALEELQSNIKDAKQGVDLSYFVNQRDEAKVTAERVAIIDLQGVLLQSAPAIMEDLGNTNYESIQREIKESLEAGAKCILFKIKSPGGSVKGCQETADYIASLDVPTIAHGTGLMCSASYKIASSCDIVSATPSCDVGNVGTLLAYTDASKAYANMGIEHKAFTNEQATLKSTFHTDTLTAEQEQFLQGQINEAGTRFIAHVKAHRPNVSDEVFKAGWYNGAKAQELGLVDGIGSFETAYQTAIALTQDAPV